MHTLAALLLVAAVHGRPEVIVPLHVTVTPDSTLRFPNVEGSNLEGRHFRLPNDLEGDLNIVLVAFRREQQEDVDTWTPFLTSVTAAHAGVKAYELPTLSRSYRLVRRFIDGGMARGIKAKATREATITLYIDKGPFKTALGIATEDLIVTLLVARDGRVLWRGDGRHSEGAAANLTSAINGAMRTGMP